MMITIMGSGIRGIDSHNYMVVCNDGFVGTYGCWEGFRNTEYLTLLEKISLENSGKNLEIFNND